MTATTRNAPLMAVGIMLAERGVYGLLWIDRELQVTARYGRLTEFIDVGEPIVEALPALIGLEASILDLEKADGAVLDLPALSHISAEGATPKLNLTFMWSRDEGAFICLVSRAARRSDLEIELTRQMRARLMAEAELAHKSRALASANADLARANRDLEEYATIISHDLKSPMRALRYMTDDLERLLGSPSPEIAGKLTEMRRHARRMGEMLTDLLEYASAGRKEEVAAEVDTHALVMAVVQSIPKPAGIEVTIAGVWPTVETAGAVLDLVLRNLIDNAVKHHDRQEGSVVVTCSECGDSLEITIEDDGPGIPPEMHAVAFLPFRKLDEGRTEGHGMGLAFVKRWVEAYGGRLRLDSTPSTCRGSRFVLQWPSLRRCNV